MKKIFVLLATTVIFAFVPNEKTITQEERNFVVQFMEQTKAQLLQDVQGLTPAQINYKSDSTRWSVAQCVEHIAVAESTLMNFVHMGLSTPADPAKRDSVKYTDAQIMAGTTDRSKKRQAPEMLRPDGKFSSYQAALDSFIVRRDRNIAFMKTSQADFRNHYFINPSIGVLDEYQAVLLIVAHSKRHTLQLEEVKASPGFPK